MSNYKFMDEDFSSISKDINIAFVMGEFNYEHTNSLVKSNKDYLLSKWFHLMETFVVPGAFELPAMTKRLLDEWHYDLVIVIWVVVRWETSHYDIIINESARGLMDISLNYETPIINGILTCENFDQVNERINHNFALSWLKLLKTCKNLY